MSSLFGQPSGGAPSIFSQPNNTSTQAPPGTGLFGSANPSTTQNKPNLFGSLSTNNPNTSQPQAGGGLFGPTTAQPAQTGGGGLFGSTPQQAQTGGGGIFGSSTSQAQPSGGLFGRVEPAKPAGGGLFGSSTAQPAQQGGGLFGSTQQNPQQQQQGSGLFGALGQSTQQQPQQQQQQGSGLFGALGQSTQQQPQQQQGGGLFGGLGQSTQQQPQQQQGGGLFGSLEQSTQQQPQQQQGGGLFGSLGQSTQQQPQQQQQQGGGGLFGSFGQPAQQQQQQQPPQQASVLGQSQAGRSRLFGDSQIEPRQKSVINQIELAFSKWNPESPSTPFQTYLYNAVPPDTAPFYGPGPQDDETKWEEALAKKPSPGAIPVAVRGFEQLGFRMKQQIQNLGVLNGRLHEINDGLNALLQKHDLEVSIRAAECRRRHLKLSRQCLGLAAKTQCLRNRGYAMDGAEEELRKKLLALEKQVFDPALDGRGEEIWARMVSVRERGRQLQREYERAGRGFGGGDDGRKGGSGIDEEILKRAMKILEDYHSQLSHLAKELEDINRDWAEYTKGRPLALTNGRY